MPKPVIVCSPWTGPDYRTATGARRLPETDPGARGPEGNYEDKICPDLTAKYIKELQDHLKTLPGGDAMAKKVAGWGVFKSVGRHICYVDPDAKKCKDNKCYRGKSAAVKALTAEASA